MKVTGMFSVIMARKRVYEDVEKFDEVDAGIASASVHGVLLSLSPVKKGKKHNYFEGTVSDGSSKLRFVGFDSAQQKVMCDLLPKKQAININNCEIKPSRRGDQMEILLKGDTKICESPKKIKISDVEFEVGSPEEVKLDALVSKYVFAKVTVTVKVQKLLDLEIVRTGKRKQEVEVADSSSSCKVILWEENIGKLSEHTSYRLENFVVREWGGRKYLSIIDDSKIIQVDDIEDVIKALETEIILTDVKLVAASDIDNHKSCLRCRARIEPSDGTFGRCSQADCRMLQRMEFCSGHQSAKLTFFRDGRFLTLSVLGKVLKKFIGKESDICDKDFLHITSLKEVRYNKTTNVITDFSF